MAADRLPDMLDGLYEEPSRRSSSPRCCRCITSHRSDGEPLSLEAGVVRVADALDMAKGRSRIPFAEGRTSIHSLSAAAIETVTIRDGVERPIMVEIEMNNSAGVYQVDELLRKKLRGSGLEDWIEVVRPHRRRVGEAARPGRPPVGRAVKPVAPARHLLRAKDLMDARYFEPLDVAAGREGRAALAGPLQPRVPPRVRRDAAPVPADAPPGARCGAAAPNRSLGGRDLPDGRPAQRRVVHDQLRAALRHVPDPLPRRLPAGRAPGDDPHLRHPGAGPSAVQHVSRRQPRATSLT